jgi:iron complex outermembrane receptor protein
MDGATMPLAPALNAVWTPNRVWQFTASAARNYRIPTFNDLYWVGTGAVGNPQLQSETARAFDFVIKSNLLTTTHRQLHVQAAGFSNQVENWILWAPLEYNLWRPDNLKCVWSRGVEAQARWKQSFAKDNSWSWHLQYRYTRATNQELYETHNANELYKQLPFTPQHEGSATAQWRYRQTGLQLVHAITGPQFTDGDNTRFLAMPGYQLTNVWISQAIHRGATHWRITAEFNNLFDVDYVARPGFPMPGRNYRIMVQFELKNEKRDE